ncbi:MAG: hypothetical protein AAFO07_11965 [Bacteroidota bacterium]
MKKTGITLLFLAILFIQVQLFSAFNMPEAGEVTYIMEPPTGLTEKVFTILDTKCNVCHRKKNPFKIFSLKNMEKNAKRINKQVFVFKRMPKGDEIKLTKEEYQTLKNWLKTLNIN